MCQFPARAIDLVGTITVHGFSEAICLWFWLNCLVDVDRRFSCLWAGCFKRARVKLSFVTVFTEMVS
jgi:hypothetical protein